MRPPESAEGEDRATDEYGKGHYQGDEVLSHSLGGIYKRIAVKIVDEEPQPCRDRHQEGDRSGKPRPDLRRRGAGTPLVFGRSRWSRVLDFFGCDFFDLPSLCPSPVSLSLECYSFLKPPAS